MRPYERPIVAAIFMLLVALAALLPLAAGPRAGALGPATARGGVDGAGGGPTRDAPRATDLRHPEGSASAGGPAACAAPGRVLTLNSRLAAVAADPAGRMDFYGGPDPETGHRGEDSHDYLRPCASADLAIVFLNPVRLTVHEPAPAGGGDGASPRPVVLGPGPLAEETRLEDGALLTRYRLPGGLLATQRLELVRAADRPASSGTPDTLKASYSVRNPTDGPAVFDLAAVLSPAKGPHTREFSGLPYLANHPARRVGDRPIGAVGVAESGVLSLERGEVPRELIVPRPGAAASSTAYWRPVGPPPDRMAFGPAGELAQGSPLPGRPGEPLPDASAFAALWDAVELAPGGSATLSYEFGPTSGWPAP